METDQYVPIVYKWYKYGEWEEKEELLGRTNVTVGD